MEFILPGNVETDVIGVNVAPNLTYDIAGSKGFAFFGPGYLLGTNLNLTGIGAPTGPSNSQSGTPGAVSYTYFVIAKNALGISLPSVGTSITTANATLSGANYNIISWAAVLGATGYDVIRANGVVGSPPSGTGSYLVGSTTTATTINDQSNSLSSYTVPSVDTTFGGISSPGHQVAGATGNTTISAFNTATSTSGNFSSPTLTLQSVYWTGAASSQDNWTIQNVLGSGATPTSTLTFSHSGSSGTATVSIIPTLATNAQTVSGNITFNTGAVLDSQSTVGSNQNDLRITAPDWLVLAGTYRNVLRGSTIFGTTDAGAEIATFLSTGITLAQPVTVSSSLTASTSLTVTGTLTSNNTNTYSFTRTLPTTVGNEVDLGSFTFTNGSGNLEIWVTVPSSGYSQCKRYFFVASYNGTNNVWQTVLPISSSGAYAANDQDLEINISNAVTSLRLRRTAGATAGTAYVTILQQGVTTDAFVASSATSAVAAPTVIYSGSIFTQIAGKLGIGNAAPASLLDVGTYNNSFYTIRTGSFVIQPYAFNNGFIADNAYYNGTNWTKISSGYASAFQFYNGQLFVLNYSSGSGTFAPLIPFKVDYSNSGTVCLGGTAISTTPGNYTGSSMVVYGTGNVTHGTTTSSGTTTPLNISSGGTYGTNTPGSSGNLKWTMYNDGTANNSYGIGMSGSLMEFRSGVGAAMAFFPNNGVEAMRILSTGVVNITSATAAGTSNTGALTFTGGGGINTGSIYVGSNTGGGGSGQAATFGINASSAGTITGVHADIRNSGTGSVTAASFTAATSSATTAGTVIGVYTNARTAATSTASSLIGFQSTLMSGTSPVTNAYNFYGSAISASSGVSAVYGLYLEAQTVGTINYGIYTAGSTPSFFGGTLTAAAYFSGTLGYSASNVFESLQSSQNLYIQAIIQNTNSGTAASADFIVSNNLSTDSTYYGDYGINSSNFVGTGSLSLPNATYLYANSGDLSLGTSTANAIHFVTNSSATDAATVDSSGNWTFNGKVGIGTSSPSGSSILDVNGAAVATGSNNYSSGIFNLTGNYYNVSSLADYWSIQNVLGTGSSPTSTLTFIHSGSTGIATVSFPAGSINPASIPTVSSSKAGVAPASGGGTTNFLRADGTWAVPPSAGGGITSVSHDSTLTGDGNATPLSVVGAVSKSMAIAFAIAL